jgi:hypothetical protein
MIVEVILSKGILKKATSASLFLLRKGGVK